MSSYLGQASDLWCALWTKQRTIAVDTWGVSLLPLCSAYIMHTYLLDRTRRVKVKFLLHILLVILDGGILHDLFLADSSVF